ncbi:Crp/Fnr family transcriptional regulator [Listeria booriae]|uniref:Crp/Fnr family transcriptional regulator n=1 Tax=Listeria booriae TaxID=1552123 RepID=A0A7X1D796_9LIST|nr:Crp/Fnr family transcriptional regulator [Listeria booriae]MBC1332791.1 Crp/Fnr family transcriptional regulator [Listeria booriae]MBC1888779.1 Crp/Fnr family transcriptional regulator [Listeria booriae]MBC2175359.1 Crp/Fnr family transcriptional regulator [Listeria booriae]MBC2388191.1 Crp/Fnr family transcriptional regulator [Listeria booriae]MBC6298966.1 Crp/Fnr family transcriptional regulator [Listeria booriae]
MSENNFFPDFTQQNDLMELLRSADGFSDFSHEQRIKKGETFTRENISNFLFRIESGTVQFGYIKDRQFIFQFFLQPGDFLTLPEYSEDLPAEGCYIALNDVSGWVVDMAFVQEVLNERDPKNYIMMEHFLRTRRKFFRASIRANLEAKQRVYFCILILIEIGFRQSKNSVELPEFVTHDVLATMANVSKSLVLSVVKFLRESEMLASNKKPWVILDLNRYMLLMAEERIPTKSAV